MESVSEMCSRTMQLVAHYFTYTNREYIVIPRLIIQQNNVDFQVFGRPYSYIVRVRFLQTIKQSL